MKLAAVRIILLEPAGALNVGSVARVMKNMGLEQLVLVNPHCDPLDPEAKLMAVHGGDILKQAQVVRSLPEALQGCQRAIATTARSRSLPTQLEPPHIALPWLLGENLDSALIFGPEERGLSNKELNYAQRFVSIPAAPEYPILNLAQAVTICAYELYQLSQETFSQDSRAASLVAPKPVEIELANIDALEGFYNHLETVLLQISYLYPHTAAARMENFAAYLTGIILVCRKLQCCEAFSEKWSGKSINLELSFV